MTKILPTIIGAFFWAWMTEVSTYGKYGIQKQTKYNKLVFFILVATLAMPVALRKSFNDTGAYIRNFYNATDLVSLFTSGELTLLSNPLFYVYQSLVRMFTDDHTIFFMFPAFFVQYSYLRFIRRHSPSLLIGVGLYLFLGTYVFSLAAMKQTIAMAILLYAADALIERRYKRYLLLVFLAFLFHTYAIGFLILPAFTCKPWSARCFLLLGAVMFVISNFESVLTPFLEFINESGKQVSAEEVIGTAAINPIRVAVYAVTPVFALVFRRYINFRKEDREHNILVNMSFLTVSIMAIGLANAANMFARMGQYFEFGLICSLPWMLKKPFEKDSERLISLIAIVCFAGYFCYANLVQIYFDDHFGKYTILEFLQRLWENAVFG